MRRSLWPIVILALMAIVSIGVSTAYLGQPHLHAGNFPHRVGPLVLQGNVVSGEAAQEQVNQLHGTRIEVQEAYIARYAAAGAAAMLWVSESATAAEAARLLVAMDAGVPSSPAFTGYRKLQDGDDVYYYVSGMGRDHYYFQEGSRVFWLSIEGVDAWPVAQEFRRVFRNFS